MPLIRAWFLPPWVWNKVYKSAFLSGTGSTFCHATLEHDRGDYFAARIALQTDVVAVPARVPLHVYSTTPFPNRRSTSSHIFQSWTGYLFSCHFFWNRVAKLRLFSLEQGQVPRQSAAHTHLKLRGVIPPGLQSSTCVYWSQDRGNMSFLLWDHLGFESAYNAKKK